MSGVDNINGSNDLGDLTEIKSELSSIQSQLEITANNTENTNNSKLQAEISGLLDEIRLTNTKEGVEKRDAYNKVVDRLTKSDFLELQEVAEQINRRKSDLAELQKAVLSNKELKLSDINSSNIENVAQKGRDNASKSVQSDLTNIAKGEGLFSKIAKKILRA